jgi:hypothetical protein
MRNRGRHQWLTSDYQSAPQLGTATPRKRPTEALPQRPKPSARDCARTAERRAPSAQRRSPLRPVRSRSSCCSKSRPAPRHPLSGSARPRSRLPDRPAASLRTLRRRLAEIDAANGAIRAHLDAALLSALEAIGAQRLRCQTLLQNPEQGIQVLRHPEMLASRAHAP